MSRTRNTAPGADQRRATAADAERWNELRRSARPVARLRQGDVDWYRISNAAGDGGEPATIDLYDEIGWYGVSAAQFVAELRGITASQIDLHISSPGGDVYDALAIYNALIDHPANVAVTVDGMAASAASFIAQAGDRVTMGRNAEMMIHDALGLCIGNAAEMVEIAGLLDKVSDNIASIYAARAGNGTVKAWRARMEVGTWYSAQEAVEAGLADEAVKTGKRSGRASPAEDRWDLSIFSYASRAEAPGPQPEPAAPSRRRPTVEATQVEGGPAPAPAPAPSPVEPGSPPASAEPSPVATDPAAQPSEPAATDVTTDVTTDEPDEDTGVDPDPAEPVTEPAPSAVAPAIAEPEATPSSTTDPDPVDDWADLTQHLTTPDQDDVFARLREAML